MAFKTLPVHWVRHIDAKAWQLTLSRTCSGADTIYTAQLKPHTPADSASVCACACVLVCSLTSTTEQKKRKEKYLSLKWRHMSLYAFVSTEKTLNVSLNHFSTLLFETGLLTDLGVHQFVSVDWPGSARNPSAFATNRSIPPCLNLNMGPEDANPDLYGWTSSTLLSAVS